MVTLMSDHTATKYQVYQNKCHARCGWAINEQLIQVFKPSQGCDRKTRASVTIVEAAAGLAVAAAVGSAATEESSSTSEQRCQW
jgi:hypothetical protein